ncbi:MAG: hypothetical protein PHF60_00340 [Candidatus ainarchaeum sp.]|nr:hypothetical protein [Candidatus ainarchaeum sp.]
MKLIGVPLEQLLLCLLITSVLTFLFFYPAISDFGNTLLGVDDIHFFMWLFWHYGQSLESGSNPLLANETYYPYGVSLAASTITPLQGVLYLILPQAWGVFGRITFLQVLPFILGGVFAFALAYRFSGSFGPSLIASFIYNFSAFHFEKALHHLNYNMAMPFIPLFFLFYYESVSRPSKERPLLLLSLALLLTALCEFTVAIMIGFIIFLDICWRYLKDSGIDPLSVRNAPLIAASIIVSVVLFDGLAVLGAPLPLVYTVPSLSFIGTCLFLVLGKQNLIRCEKERRYLTDMAVCAAPLLIYALVLYLQPSYTFLADTVLGNYVAWSVPIDFVLWPSELQEISHAGIFTPLAASTESGVYLGPVILLLVVGSYLAGKAGEEEGYFRNMFWLCLLFAFPVVGIGDAIVAVTPFFVGPLFPMLGVLRDPSRFIMFALLFLSVAIALFCTRLRHGGKRWLSLAIAAALLVSVWPALWTFRFDTTVPGFYAQLAEDDSDARIFLYPNGNYYTMLEQTYYQTLHGKTLSVGTLSRLPKEGNELYRLYFYSETHLDAGEVAAIARRNGYDYMVVQKLRCDEISECFYGTPGTIDAEKLENVTRPLENEFGKPIYEDSTIIVYKIDAD